MALLEPLGRGVYGLGWVELRRFFDPTHHGGLKKIQPNLTYHISPTQPNPTYMSWVGLNSWVGQLGKRIKAIRSDYGGEYLLRDFKDYLT